MNIEIIKTVTKDISEEYDISIRTVKIDGVMHLQMQGRDHEIIRPSWSKGVIMTCPESVDIDAIISDLNGECSRYYNGYGEGCEMLEAVPEELY